MALSLDPVAEQYQLIGHHVRIVWRDPPTKIGGAKTEQTIFRGQVAHLETHGLWLWGRFFQEKVDTRSIREMPRDKDAEHRLYFAPWPSIDSVQIIQENTKDHELHKIILSRGGEAPSPPPTTI